jgi:hypothetical protein
MSVPIALPAPLAAKTNVRSMRSGRRPYTVASTVETAAMAAATRAREESTHG